MEWTVLNFSKGAVDRAAKTLVDPLASNEEIASATIAVNNWRAAHNFPLNTFQVGLRRRAQVVDPGSLVAQRIKRMSSIEAKLIRFSKMRMTQMQDIGGCRAILQSVSQVTDLVSAYAGSDLKHKLDTKDDYISVPQASGYRGVHLIYRYFSDKGDDYNGLFIEMQVRTRMQHAWATAVETADTFLRQKLKSSQGSPEWLRFFALMGSFIATREKCPAVPGTPSGQDLLDEIEYLEAKLNVRYALSMYQQAIKVTEAEPQLGNHYFLLVLEPQKGEMSVRGFTKNQQEEASSVYAQEESRISDSVGAEAVLVSVSDISALRRAYPNYFADTTVFLQQVTQVTNTAKVRRLAREMQSKKS